ncbi:hypothetical protein AB4144_27120, partial [Rhizobiaceae sp. 2RAB30]
GKSFSQLNLRIFLQSRQVAKSVFADVTRASHPLVGRALAPVDLDEAIFTQHETLTIGSAIRNARAVSPAALDGTRSRDTGLTAGFAGLSVSPTEGVVPAGWR